jgi:predicted transcriptional regulator YheO
MTEANVVFTPADHKIIDSYKVLVEGLADYLGDGYEIVLHSLENMDKSVVKIINGHYTGRKEGAPITDLALGMLSKITDDGRPGYISYIAKNKKGEPLKSTTINIKGVEGNIIGLLCINFYMNTPLLQIIESFYNKTVPFENSVSETFVENTKELLSKTVELAKEQVENDQTILPSNKNREIISLLFQRGVFKIKDSVIFVAEYLGISKHTVYLHLRNIK